MFSHLKKALEIIRIVKSKENIGDAAALKLTFSKKTEEITPYTSAVLALKKETFEPIDIFQLKLLPEPSFGYQYYKFLTENSLYPLNFSSKSDGIYDLHPVSMRYIRVHDMFHVILGFDPSPSGEAGVYAFIQAQQYNQKLSQAAQTAKLVSKLMFWRSREISLAYDRGSSMGRRAKPFIEIPFERYLSTPLEELRSQWLVENGK